MFQMATEKLDEYLREHLSGEGRKSKTKVIEKGNLIVGK